MFLLAVGCIGMRCFCIIRLNALEHADAEKAKREQIKSKEPYIAETFVEI